MKQNPQQLARPLDKNSKVMRQQDLNNMIERMERDGVVGPADGAKPREVLIRGVGDMPGAGAM